MNIFIYYIFAGYAAKLGAGYSAKIGKEKKPAYPKVNVVEEKVAEGLTEHRVEFEAGGVLHQPREIYFRMRSHIVATAEGRIGVPLFN